MAFKRRPGSGLYWLCVGAARARQRSYLNDGFTVDQLLNSQSVYGRNLWVLLGLELWQNQFIDA